MSPEVNVGDTAWMLAATALVLLMTPALGLFYAGLVRARNTLNTFMMCVAALAVATISWALIGYSLAFDGDGPIIGGLGHAFLQDVDVRAARWDDDPAPAVLRLPGDVLHHHRRAGLGRRGRAHALRRVPDLRRLWSVLVYAVLAHWAFGGGWLQEGGTLDFAGGVPVEMGSGFSAIAAAIVVGARKDYGRQALLPHNAVYVLLGAGLLWFGWFGFNGGSGFSAGNAERAGVHQHAADAGVHALRLVPARPRPRPAGHGDRRGDGDHRRLRRHHPGGRVHQPDGRDAARRARRAAELRRRHVAPAHAPGRDARRPRRARHRRPHGHPVHRLLRLSRGTASRTACCTATPSSSAGRRWPRSARRRTRSSSRTSCSRPRRADAAARDDREQALGMDVTEHGEEAYATGEGAILVGPIGTRIPIQLGRSPRSRPRRRRSSSELGLLSIRGKPSKLFTFRLSAPK